MLGPQEKGAPHANEKAPPEDTRKSVYDRLRQFEHIKVSQEEIVEYLANSAPGNMRILDKLLGCASYLCFHDYYLIDENSLVAANFCKQHHWCQSCAMRRSALSVLAYLEKLQCMEFQSPLYPHLITHTVKNSEDLMTSFAKLRNGLTRLSKRRVLVNRYPETIWKSFLGGVTAFEIKKGKNSGLWHPHSHSFVLSKRSGFSKKQIRTWKDEWLEVTGDSHVVNIEPIHEVREGLVETLKYAAKFSDLTPQERDHMVTVVRNRPMQIPWGCFRGVKAPDKLTDEARQGEPYFEAVYALTSALRYSLIRSRYSDGEAVEVA